MKIKISDDEVYEIKIPNEMEAQEFLGLLDKLSKIVKLITLSKLGNLDKFKKTFNQRTEDTIQRKKYQKTTGLNPFYDTKEKALDLLQYSYHGTKEDRQWISRLMGMEWKDIQKRLSNIRGRYEIQPNEVGLKKFPSMYDRTDYKIQDWIIKSYTGIFDESENGNNN